MLTSTDRVTPSPEVVLRDDFTDAAVLFHPHTAEAVCISPVGVSMWRALDGCRTLAEVAEEVAAQCGVPLDTVLEDTLTFVSYLHRRLFASLVPQDDPH